MNVITTERYRKFLKNNGYGEGTIAAYIRAITNLQDPSSLNDPLLLLEYIDSTLMLKKDFLSNSNYISARASLNAFFFMVTDIRIKDFRKQLHHADHFSPIMDSFSDYCINFLHLTSPVTDASVREVRLFLSAVVEDIDKTDWSSITAQDIVNFLRKERSGLSSSSLGITVTAIRRFFRFLQHNEKSIHKSVLTLPLATPNWGKNSQLPITLSDQDRKRLMNYQFPETKTGLRDQAILCCFTELGLRCCEVAGLHLSDIKWNQGTIAIRKTKTHCSRELPMSEKLGQVLEHYIMEARPNGLGDSLFFRCGPGIQQPSTTDSIRCAIRRIYEKTGITGPHVGTHALRRSVGSNLYSAGNSLKTVADLLGHNSMSATKAYVRIDIKSLRDVISPWPERSKA